jgi:hypothetical protein
LLTDRILGKALDLTADALRDESRASICDRLVCVYARAFDRTPDGCAVTLDGIAVNFEERYYRAHRNLVHSAHERRERPTVLARYVRRMRLHGYALDKRTRCATSTD